VSSGYNVKEEAKLCHLYVTGRNRPGINKVTYTIYMEWSGRALMNNIKENKYDVNVLWKENIAYLWVWENNFVSTIADNYDFS
jgi:hypothetical protein